MSERPSILIVDDNEALAQTLRDIVELKGYHAAVATSGIEAIMLLEATSFSCVISDVRMPALNGMELYHLVRKRHPDTRVLLMSAYVEDGAVLTGLGEGAPPVLRKPLDIPLLLSLVS